jgi:DNA polymerase-4
MKRAIIHVDLDAFYCAVEELRTPKLRGQPFAVGGRPEGRGVVASCSYAARAFGVHSAMPMGRAIRLCPQLIIVPPNFPLYRRASRAVMARLHAITDRVEQLSIDEAFLDVTGHATPAATLAVELQAQIRDELRLPCSLGVASNKLVAKIATDVGKVARRTGQTPSALCVVPPGEEAAFLAPLPTSVLWGVGPKTAERLAALGIQTIGDIAARSVEALVREFGKHGHDLAQHARGIDERPVTTERVARSISKETTFAQDVRDSETLWQTVQEQAAQVARKLRAEELTGTTVKLKLRWMDFTTLTRQTSVGPTDDEVLLAQVARWLLEQVWVRGRPVRLIGVGISGLEARARQLSLLTPDVQDAGGRNRRLQADSGTARERIGDDALRHGSEH